MAVSSRIIIIIIISPFSLIPSFYLFLWVLVKSALHVHQMLSARISAAAS
jgi:hypothetical protein